MKLEVGMYVRTKNGMISKIISKEDVSGSLHREEIVFILDNGNRLALHSKKVIKASHNIIDLIQVGDYVNGYKVTRIGGTYHGRKDRAIYCDYQENEKTGKWIMIYDDEIKSIVTKEQFESMKYSLEG